VPLSQIGRAFVALLCMALFLWCAVSAPPAAHADLAILVLTFCFLAPAGVSPLGAPRGDCAAPASPFLAVHTSRAPPSA